MPESAGSATSSAKDDKPVSSSLAAELDVADIEARRLQIPPTQTYLIGTAFVPIYKSILEYALVRDFAYDSNDILHYGAEEREQASEDGSHQEEETPGDMGMTWEQIKSRWSEDTGEGKQSRNPNVVPLSLRDGPPYAIDPDLQSPVVTTTRKRRSRVQADMAGGHRHSRLNGDSEDAEGSLGVAPSNSRRDSHFATGRPLHRRDSRPAQPEPSSDDEEYDESQDMDGDSEYSRDYQFTITSPDEEMHGKAVALFDFARENENELPLVEGQVIWVSYRHGQGWLVAEDPKTHESGLVPEEYVRLLRDIQGGWSSLNGLSDSQSFSPEDEHPTEHHSPLQMHAPYTADDASPIAMSKSSSQQSNGARERILPIVSTFSTSSKDIDPFPSHLLAGTKEGNMTPPKVEHYHGQGGFSVSATQSPVEKPHAVTAATAEVKD